MSTPILIPSPYVPICPPPEPPTPKARRFRLMNLSDAVRVPGWKLVNEGLRYSCMSDARTVTVTADLWDGNEPVKECCEMMEDLSSQLDLLHMPVPCVALQCKFVALPLELLIDITGGRCVCDIKWLFSFGCKCGGFQREQAIRRRK